MNHLNAIPAPQKCVSAAEARTLEVPTRFSNLIGMIDALESEFAQLHARLENAGVLSDRHPTETPQAKGQESTTRLGDEMNRQAERVASLSCEVRSLSQRLEI